MVHRRAARQLVYNLNIGIGDQGSGKGVGDQGTGIRDREWWLGLGVWFVSIS